MGGTGRGGNKRGRTQRRDFRDGRPNVWKKPRPDPSVAAPASEAGWMPFVMESPSFDLFYMKQGIVPLEEWDEFISTLRKPLPTTFRINGSGQFAHEIRDQIQREFFDYLKSCAEVDGEEIEPARPLPWYPDNLAWHLSFSRMQLRKLSILERIHEFLKQENEIGSITRQEAVSMLPPLFLDVQPHHRVLDMCAAPGSKTFQLLEMIHRADTPGELSDGMVIANDLDVQRCHLLIHQTKRMCSPNILVTNHEAQHFPGLKGGGSYGDATVKIEEDGKGLLFDCILCDVPCSGDGTIRKAPDIWRKWNCGVANGLHRLQVQIAMRGVALLKVGGRLVYSTCSLNPVEDEAVVGEILRESGGCLELLDMSSELPELKRRPGLISWKVRDRKRWLCSASQIDRHRAGAVVPGMFPSGNGWDLIDGNDPSSKDGASTAPTDMEDAVDEKKEIVEEIDTEEGPAEVASLPLERCMRILPHDQDTGGFFIAVFQKTSPFKVVHNCKGGNQKLPCAPADEELAVPQISESEVDSTALNNNEPNPSKFQDSKVDGLFPEYGQSAGSADNLATTIGQGNSCANPSENNRKTEDSIVGNVLQGEALTSENTVSGQEEDDCKEFKEANNIERSVELEREVEAKPTNQRVTGGRFQRQGRWRGVDPVLFLKDEQVIGSLIAYYGIRDSFPLRGHLVTRSEDASRLKRIYYVSRSVSDAIQRNFHAGEQLKITSAGLKIFERQQPKDGTSPCAFRIASEGLPVLLPHMTKQIVFASKTDFKLLLSTKAVPFSAFNEFSFSAALQSLLPGCCVVALPSKESGTDNATEDRTSPEIAVGCWRGRTNVSLLITKAEALQMLQRLSLNAVNMLPTAAKGEEEVGQPAELPTSDLEPADVGMPLAVGASEETANSFSSIDALSGLHNETVKSEPHEMTSLHLSDKGPSESAPKAESAEAMDIDTQNIAPPLSQV